MEKSISSRFYFDYNATSPLSKKVQAFLGNGEFFFGNPSSIHTTGKSAKKVINETSLFLFKTFNLKELNFNIFYHSGASEGINTFFKGIAFEGFRLKKQYFFYFSTVDHACAFNLKDSLEILGHKVIYFDVDRNGLFSEKALVDQILKNDPNGVRSFINYTYINNESGVVWNLDIAKKIKEKTNATIHVDAVQLPGKIPLWNNLNNDLDAYTFSGHKFGALKGVGFTFLGKSLNIDPLIVGGNQQSSMRAGTENALGIYTLKLALEDCISQFKPDQLFEEKMYLERMFLDVIGNKGEIVAIKNPSRNLNTIFLILYGHKAEDLSMRFDLSGVDLSTGSACSSGIFKENRILISMGYSVENSKSCLRFSFSPFMTKEESLQYAIKIKTILSDILK